MDAKHRASDTKSRLEAGMDMHSHSHSRANSVGAVEVRGAKRKSPGSDDDLEQDLGRDSDERPEKKRKWQEGGKEERVHV